MIDLNVIFNIGWFILGLIVGYILRGLTCKMDRTNEATLIMLTVTVVWSISVIVDMLSTEYETPMLVHGIMGGIVGYFFKFKIEGTTK